MRRSSLAALALVALASCAPSAGGWQRYLDEHPETTAEAVTVGWQFQYGPFVCNSPFHPWDPSVSPWPQHGWCVFQPQPGAPESTMPWRTRACTAGQMPWPGTANLYSDFRQGGSCARAFGDQGAGYTFDTDIFQSEGWYANEQAGGYAAARIKSIRLAPHTTFSYCDQPMQFGCASGHGNTLVNNVGGDSWYDDITWVPIASGSNFVHQIDVAAFQLGFN